MRKLTYRVFALLMIFPVFLLSVPFVNASENSPETGAVTIIETADTRIDYYEDEDGAAYYLQYVNGVIDQVNIIRGDGSNTIECHHYDADGNEISVSVISPEAYGTLTTYTPAAPYGLNSYTLYGKINYQATVDTGTVGYTQVLNLNTSSPYQTEYTVNSYLGELVNLVALFVSALQVPYTIINPFFTALVNGAVIEVVGGAIVNALTITLSSTCTDYTWKIYDEEYPSSVSYYNGAKYIINSNTADGKYYGDIFHEGITPIHWGTATMSTVFHNLTYGYTVWSVTSWTAYA